MEKLSQNPSPPAARLAVHPRRLAAGGEAEDDEQHREIAELPQGPP